MSEIIIERVESVRTHIISHKGGILTSIFLEGDIESFSSKLELQIVNSKTNGKFVSIPCYAFCFSCQGDYNDNNIQNIMSLPGRDNLLSLALTHCLN